MLPVKTRSTNGTGAAAGAPGRLLLGSHLSVAGGMTNALDEAERLGMDCVQVFTKNQQQWKARPLDEGDVRAWRSRVAELGWDGARTVSHASYLINLASPDDELWARSVDLMTIEIERCEALGIAFLVHHPGAYTTSTRKAGLSRIIDAYAELFRRTRGFGTVSCLENTVGSGSNLGGRFEEIAALRASIIERTGEERRVGFCIDTCHAHAAGYDLSRAESAATAIAELDAACGLANVRVLHLNDSKAPCGSRRDRHEHIGKGTIGAAGFAAVVNHAGLRDRPMIMETPKGDTPGGTPLDSLNLRKLRQLAGLRSGGRTRGGVRAS